MMGYVDIPFIYNVRTIRTGKSYAIRAVEVTQEEGKGVCFTCTCSFKLEDWNPLELQDRVDIQEQYKDVLTGNWPEDLPDAPLTEMPMSVRRTGEEWNKVADSLAGSAISISRSQQQEAPSPVSSQRKST